MREKALALIITFPSTTAAMEAERYCLAQQLPGRLIPVPLEITAGCGLAWKAPPEEEALLRRALEGAALTWSSMCVIQC